jgi:hypothetical protein
VCIGRSSAAYDRHVPRLHLRLYCVYSFKVASMLRTVAPYPFVDAGRTLGLVKLTIDMIPGQRYVKSNP